MPRGPDEGPERRSTIETLELRPLEGWQEFRACETFQRRIWGDDFSEVAPASLLKIGQRVGGVSSGAFHEDEGLVGFVFGLTGLSDGGPVHWSHMLAVRRDFRDRGLGRLLKEHQRELVMARGVETVYWSYDPLVARNAHFNLNRLGARVEEYVPQMYGETGSRLHQGLGTDRFVVAWDLASYSPGGRAGAPDEAASTGRDAGGAGEGEQPGRPEGGEDSDFGSDGDRTPDAVGTPDGLPAGADLPGGGAPAAGGPEGPAAPPVVRVEIPSDIHAVRENDPDAAVEWRERTREAFLSRLDAGYRVVGFVPGPDRGFYVLAREDIDPGGPDAAPPDG